jgi:hypothetical protein
MTRPRVFLTIAVTSGVLAFCGPTIAAQHHSGSNRNSREPDFTTKLQTPISDFDASGLPLAQLAIRLAYEHRVPLAFEYADEDAVRKPLRMKLGGYSLREVIAAIVTPLHEYRVDFSHGIVDIYCPAARLDPSNPLNTVIPRYDAEHLDTHFADAQLLCAISALRGGGCGGSIAGGQWGPITITLHLVNRRVYQILNSIVAQNGHAIWVPLVRHTGPSAVPMNFWYIYPLDAPFEASALKTLEQSAPKRGAGVP